MHSWGDENVDWKGINSAAEFIGVNLRRWGRVNVRDYKEKFGTVRVYCSLGWHQFHSITHPGWCRAQYPKWLWHLDCRVGSKIISPLNRVILPYHIWLYRHLYSMAVRKWPHLRREILCMADYGDLLKGL